MTRRRRSKLGGARPGAGRKPRTGATRTVVKTVKLTPDEYDRTRDAAGDTPWGTWAADTLTAAAGVLPRQADRTT